MSTLLLPQTAAPHLATILGDLSKLAPLRSYGRVVRVIGMMVEVEGLDSNITIGGHCLIHTSTGVTPCEIIGFENDRALMMPYARVEGISLGARVDGIGDRLTVYPSQHWLGRVVNALGEPLDEGPPLTKGSRPYLLHNSPPPAHQRTRVGQRLDLGVKAINTFATCCRGQRMGIFAGSGVGKSSILSMMARYTSADVIVIGLVGERGREVQEFIQENLGEEGLQRSVMVVATSDESPLMRRAAAYMTLTVAEYFRDQGKDVLCLMDSVTRFAMAQREIGLTVGEPPATRGYTPSVFAELPKLLERAGTGVKGSGTITGLFTVLVEGDDHNEPISDAVRGILDGHIVLDRRIAERGRFPAVNILRSVSRTMPGCNDPTEQTFIKKAITSAALYEDMADMIRLGAYKSGSDKQVDEAVKFYPRLEAFLSQSVDVSFSLEEGFKELSKLGS